MDLEEARRNTMSKSQEGIECPCCDQFVKVYKRKLNTNMALYLIRLYNLGDGVFHISEIKDANRGGDFSKMRFYGFIEEQINESTSKRTSGMWKITEEGRSFVLKESKVHSHFKMYNGNLLGFVGDRIDIDEALGQKFDYTELMNR